ncbi:MAG: hypothetical protein QG604_421 [Candidatus Dependentiae bacterium]|nr:hypothetical protein [Candidatus Dependentiae bacterium]
MPKNKKELEYQRFLKDLKEVIASNRSLLSLGDFPDANDFGEDDFEVAEQSKTVERSVFRKDEA